jgi:hypothetical protein
MEFHTIEPIEPPWQAVKEWIPDDEPNLDWFNRPRNPTESELDPFDQSPAWGKHRGQSRFSILFISRPASRFAFFQSTPQPGPGSVATSVAARVATPIDRLTRSVEGGGYP